MFKRLSVLTALSVLAASCGGSSPDSSAPDAVSDVSLAVLVVIDQLRPDLIDQYADLWTGGLKRLSDEGFRYDNASHDHAITETAVGHATLATGAYPRTHGLAANSWWQETGDPDIPWVDMYAVEDRAQRVVGAPNAVGRSPENLRASGLGEWIKAADPAAEVVAISKKDRAAISIAGKVPDAHVYWVDHPTGQFVTSAWYRSELPTWVQAMNTEEMGGVFADTVWQSGLPLMWAQRTRRDTFPMEGNRTNTAFPHRAWNETIDEVVARNLWVAERTLRMDPPVLSLANRAIDALSLGQRGTTDYLALAFSSTDYVGHAFGPFSREQLDNLRQLDRLLGELFQTLDEKVGEGRWVVGFSADHGVQTMPEWLTEQGIESHRTTREEDRELALAVRNAASPADAASVAETFRQVAEAYTHDELRALAAGSDDVDMDERFHRLYRNSWVDGRYADDHARSGVAVRYVENVLEGRYFGGTTHGSPYGYDREVPIIFLGAGVNAGTSSEEAFTVDVAPTLAYLTGIAAGDQADGRRLSLGR